MKHLPGIVKASLAMPDIHWGCGLPIGGAAAFPQAGWAQNSTITRQGALTDQGAVAKGTCDLRFILRNARPVARSAARVKTNVALTTGLTTFAPPSGAPFAVGSASLVPSLKVRSVRFPACLFGRRPVHLRTCYEFRNDGNEPRS